MHTIFPKMAVDICTCSWLIQSTLLSGNSWWEGEDSNLSPVTGSGLQADYGIQSALPSHGGMRRTRTPSRSALTP